MDRRQESRMEYIRKDVLTATVRQIAVKTFEIRQAAAEDDDLRIEDVDDAGQRPSETRLVALQRRLATHITAFGAFIDFERSTSCAVMTASSTLRCPPPTLTSTPSTSACFRRMSATRAAASLVRSRLVPGGSFIDDDDDVLIDARHELAADEAEEQERADEDRRP